MSEIDVEQLVHNIETTGNADGEPEKQARTPEPEGKDDIPNEPTPLNFKSNDDLFKHQLKYNANGKEVTEDIATILKRASQGYHYAQRMNEIKTNESEWTQKVSEAQSLNEKWSKFENFAKENPEWYQHWSNAWENRAAGGAQESTNNSEASGGIDETRLTQLVESKIAPIKEFAQSQQEKEEQARLAEQDRLLENQISEVKKAYPDIDLEASDPETGKTLEHQVLEFGIDKGIKDFDAAFKVFYHDKLVARQVERAKSDVSKKIQLNSKAGILGYNPTPSTKKTAPNMNGLNYDQITDMAAKEFGLK